MVIKVGGYQVDGTARIPYSQTLNLFIDVRPILSMSNGVLIWRKDGEGGTKKTLIEIKNGTLMHIKLIEINNTVFEVDLKEITPGRKFELIVSPRSTQNIEQGMAILEAEVDGKKSNHLIHFLIK